MEEELRTLVLADSAVSSVIGTRYFPVERRQGAQLPAILYQGVSGFEGAHMNGTGPFEARVQLDCYAMTYAVAKLLSRAVIEALHTYRGGGFLFIKHDGFRDDETGGSNEAERPFRVGLDFNITWRPI